MIPNRDRLAKARRRAAAPPAPPAPTLERARASYITRSALGTRATITTTTTTTKRNHG